MLDELDIRDFALADHLRIRFDPGFTAITGETGAGKSLIVDALGVLLGDRAGPDLIRTGAKVARIEGTFVISSGDEDLDATLSDLGIEPEGGVLIVSRELLASGRSSARINGRAVVQSALATIGGRLVDIHSQTEHVAILRPAEHVNYLDRYSGTLPERAALSRDVAELRRLRAELERLRASARERTRLQERLAYEVQEIEAAEIRPDEEDELRRERSRLANAEQIAQLAAQAYAALEGSGEANGAVEALGEAASLVTQLARLDESLSGDAIQLEALQSQATDLSRSLRAYGEGVEYNPERLQEIEERLAALSGLKRKYGATLEEVCAYAVKARSELQELESSEERITALQEEEVTACESLGRRCQTLSERRRLSAQRLGAAIETELAELGLARGRFGVRFDLRADAAGIPVELTAATVTAAGAEESQERVSLAGVDRTGVDQVEFLVSLNSGEPLRPLGRVASGGETSRLMLALKSILGTADSVPTLVFDEVDAGVGGRSGRIVGQKLCGLAGHHQVICITHLPQIASMSACHLVIEKRLKGETTVVAARELRGEERLEEVAAMLGGASAATRASARELLGDAIC